MSLEHKRAETKMVTILNINASRKILPRMGAVPALQMQANLVRELVEVSCHHEHATAQKNVDLFG